MACLGIFAPYTYLNSIRVKASWSIQRKLASNTPNELPVGGVMHEKSRSGRENWKIVEQESRHLPPRWHLRSALLIVKALRTLLESPRPPKPPHRGLSGVEAGAEHTQVNREPHENARKSPRRRIG
jgi:hypothetical protein